MKKLRRAFTLIELLAVIAIIGVLAAVLAGLRPSDPAGLDGASAQVRSAFDLARAQAILGNNPDPDFPDYKLYTPRARVIVLKDQEDDQNHLRRVGVILGGQLADPANPQGVKSEKELQEGDLSWYAVGEGFLLPDGIFYVDEANTKITNKLLRSDAVNKTFPSQPTMRVAFPSRKSSKTTTQAPKTWYYYEFLGNGTANMTDSQEKTGARFIVAQGILDPSTKQLTPENGKENIVGGLLVLRGGNTVPIKNYEAE